MFIINSNFDDFFLVEIFYAGETISRRTVVSLTCSHCGQAGFIPRTLLTHCIEKHPSTAVPDKNNQAVVCKTFISLSYREKKKEYFSFFRKKKHFVFYKYLLISRFCF